MPYHKPRPNPVYNVKDWRRRMGGLTQAEAADLIGCNERSLRDWERNGITPLPLFRKKMDALIAEKQGAAQPQTPVQSAGPLPRRRLQIEQPRESMGIMPSSLRL